MNIQIEKKPNCITEMQVEIPADHVAKKREAITKAYASKARIPGFRKGKVPASVIDKRFSKAIEGELRDTLVSESVEHAIDKENLDVLTIDNVAEDTFDADGNFRFRVLTTTQPEFELPEYKGIPVNAPKLEVTESQIDKALNDLRTTQGDFVEVKDRPLATGDIAIINYTVKLNDTPLAESAPNLPPHLTGNDDHWLRMSETGFLPGFCKAIEGMKPGETKTGIESTLPEELEDENLRGAKVTCDVEIKSIKEEILPEINDAYACKILASEDATVDTLRERIREHILGDISRRREESIEDQLVQHLNQAVNIDLPTQMIQRETQNRVDSMVRRGIDQGVPEEEITSQQEQIFRAAENQARLKVKTHFLVQRIADKENITVDNTEMIQQIGLMAEEAGKPLKKFIKDLEKQKALGAIQMNLRARKTLVFLREHASVSEISQSDQPAEQPPAGQPAEQQQADQSADQSAEQPPADQDPSDEPSKS